MDSVNTTSDLTAQQALNAAASFFASMSPALGGDSADMKLFADFLSQTQDAVNPAPQAADPAPVNVPTDNAGGGASGDASNPAPQTPVAAADTQATSAAAPSGPLSPSAAAASSSPATTAQPAPLPLATLRNVAETLRHIMQKLEAYQNSKGRNKSAAQTANTVNGNAAAASGNGDSTPKSGAAGNTISGSASAGTAATNANSGNGASNTTDPVLSSLAAMLLVLQQLEKQIQAALTAIGSPATGAPQTASTAAASGAAADATSGDGPVAPGLSAADLSFLAALGNLFSNMMSSSSGAAQTAAGGDTGAAAGTGSQTPLSMAQVLGNLLALTQMVEKKLELATGLGTDVTASGAQASAGTDAMGSSAAALPSDAQIDADIKAFIDALQTGAGDAQPGSGNQGTGAASGTADNATAAANASTAANTASPAMPLGISFANFPIPSLTLPPASASAATQGNGAVQLAGSAASGASDASGKTADQLAAQAADSSWAQADSFLASYKSDAANGSATGANTASTNSFAVFADAMTANKDDASLDLGMGQQGQNGSATAGNGAKDALNNGALPAFADGTKAADPYSFASQLSAARAANGGTTGLPDVVDQVVLQIYRNVRSGNDQMSLQLNPADLGRVNIKLDMSSDGKVQGTVVADNPATLNLLLKDVRGLERALQEAGLRADPGSLQFSLGGQSGNSSGQTGNFSPSGSPYGNGSALPDITSDLSTLPNDTAETYYLTPGRVNLKV